MLHLEHLQTHLNSERAAPQKMESAKLILEKQARKLSYKNETKIEIKAINDLWYFFIRILPNGFRRRTVSTPILAPHFPAF